MKEICTEKLPESLKGGWRNGGEMILYYFPWRWPSSHFKTGTDGLRRGIHPALPCNQDVFRKRNRTGTGTHMAQKIFDKGNSFYVCYSVAYLDLNGVYFIFNYSLLVKRTSRPDGYRPDCKCSEKLYLTVEEVTTTLSLAFHNILWTARSIVKYQFSMSLWDAMEGFL